METEKTLFPTKWPTGLPFCSFLFFPRTWGALAGLGNANFLIKSDQPPFQSLCFYLGNPSSTIFFTLGTFSALLAQFIS